MTQQASAELVLSPKAYKVGGALVRIFDDPTEVARYGSKEPQSKDMRAIGELVAEHHNLNTDEAIGTLLWLTTFHGETIGLWIEELVEEYSLAEVSLVIEYLYDVAVRVDGDSISKEENEAAREYVPLLLELLRHHKELYTESEIRTPEQLVVLVEALGGLVTAGDYDSPERIEEALEEYRSRED